MSAAGIICEYNPFHEGHQFHIQQVREKTGADTVVALLNGDFVQGGASHCGQIHPYPHGAGGRRGYGV